MLVLKLMRDSEIIIRRRDTKEVICRQRLNEGERPTKIAFDAEYEIEIVRSKWLERKEVAP